MDFDRAKLKEAIEVSEIYRPQEEGNTDIKFVSVGLLF